MTIKAIDTTYSGCRFRSRLEARWAVFFDHLGVAWEYEPQGFEVTRRLTSPWCEDTFRYLPDFWLPDLKVWGEVKGELTRPDAVRLLDAAASLSSADEGGCGAGRDLVVFGRLTNSVYPSPPIRLHMHEGALVASCFWCNDQHGWSTGSRQLVDVGDDDNGEASIPPRVEEHLVRGFACQRHMDTHADALRAARSARFEFGAGRKRVPSL